MEVKITAYSEPPKLGWKDVTPLLAIAVLPALFLPTFASLTHKWAQWTEGLSHGFLLIGIFIYLVYRALPFVSTQPSSAQRLFTGLTLIGLSSVWAIFALIDINLLAEFAVLGCLALFIAHLYGVRTVWHHRFLLLLPLFSITLWEHLNGPLVSLSGTMVGEMVRLIDIPAVIDGSSIFIPYGHIVIADGCSGLRYFIIALAMGYLISYLNGYSEKGFLITLCIAAVLALVSNWLRIFILILVGYFTEMESSLMTEHDMFGWLLFACVCFPAIYFAPVLKSSSRQVDISPARPGLSVIGLSFLLISTGPLIYWLLPAPTSDNLPRLSAPPTFQPIAQTNNPLLLVLSDDRFLQSPQTYLRAGDSYLTVNQVQRTQKGQKLVPYLGGLYDKELWHRSPAHTAELPALPVAGSATELRAKGGLQKVAQIQWFRVGNFTTASATQAKLLQILAAVANQNNFQLVTLRQLCSNDGCSHAFRNLATHAQNLHATMKDN